MSTEPYAFKVREAAKMVGCSRYVLYDAMKAGELEFFQPHEKADRLIPADALRAWIKRNTRRYSASAA